MRVPGRPARQPRVHFCRKAKHATPRQAALLLPPATAPSANGDCSDFDAGGVAAYYGLRVTDRAGAPGDGSGGCRRCGARCRRGGAPGRLPRQLRAMQGPARASRPSPIAPRHRHLQVCIFFSGTPSCAFCEHLVLAGFSTIERGICFFFLLVFRLCFYCTISGTICICSVNLV